MYYRFVNRNTTLKSTRNKLETKWIIKLTPQGKYTAICIAKTKAPNLFKHLS